MINAWLAEGPLELDEREIFTDNNVVFVAQPFQPLTQRFIAE